MNQNFQISTDNSKLDIDMIHSFLAKESYWAKDRSFDQVFNSIKNSLCFGIYDNDKQIGFARVVTDYTTFAWILDLFIIKDYRNKGLATNLMDSITKNKDLQDLQRWGLATTDAHSLYKKFGFKVLKNPEVFMERVL